MSATFVPREAVGPAASPAASAVAEAAAAGAAGGPMVSARNLTKWFKGLVAVSDVSFDVGPGVTACFGVDASSSAASRMSAMPDAGCPAAYAVHAFSSSTRT